jgi:hypothetical protein
LVDQTAGLDWTDGMRVGQRGQAERQYRQTGRKVADGQADFVFKALLGRREKHLFKISNLIAWMGG